MNSIQFFAVVLLFIVITAFILYTANRKKGKEKYEAIMNERLRIAVSYVQLQGPFEIQKFEIKGRPRGHSWEEMVMVDSLWLLEKNGFLDERSGVRIPDWIIKEYKKRLNADY